MVSAPYAGPDGSFRRNFAWARLALALRRAFRGRDEPGLGAEMDRLKGLPMKVGLHLSFHASPVAAATRRSLESLQEGRAAMPFEAARAVLEEGLGASLEAAFEAFEAEPVAAGSIAQVHRARHAGRDVAVKVRYPHIADAVDLDLARLRQLLGLGGADREVLDALTETLRGEVDLAREARAQARFGARLAAEADLAVPEVVEERSSAAVLTTTYVGALPFARFCREAPPPARRRAAEALLRLTYRSLLVDGEIQSDPHPGNFRVDPDGRVHALDFGSVQAVPPSLRAGLRAQLQAERAGDEAAAEAALDLLGVVGAPTFDRAHSRETYALLHGPLHGPVRVTEAALAAAAERLGPTNPNRAKTRPPAAFLFGQRLEWGTLALLAALDVEVDGRAVRDALLDGR